MFVNLGIGTAGFTLLAACGSDETASGDTTSVAPSGTDSPTSPTTAGDTSDPQERDDAGETVQSDGELRLEHVSLGFVSAYVLVRGDEAAVVDTGVSGSGTAIFEALAGVGLTPADVRHIVLTHDHGDHIGSLAELEAETTDATVHAGPGDVESITTSLQLNEVADGDEVFGLGVVATPGHTPGSISVFDTATGLLVAGDAINGDGSGGLTGPNPDFTPDMDTANESVAKLAELDVRVAAFGHGGPPVTDDAQAKLAALV